MPDATPAKPTAPDSPEARPDVPPKPVDDLIEREHTMRVGRRSLRYRTAAGRVVLRAEKIDDGTFAGFEPRAEMFLTSYVLADADPATRPVTFCFNGGPGSSSVWLHLGLFGPRRVLMGDAGNLLPPPYGLADNGETLLAHTDLVFIDPVSTGYSRAVAGGKPADFHGYKPDVESVGELIRLWTSRHGRWMSPKFLAGESYGTLRAAALADHLQETYGLYPNGIMLISSVLNLATLWPHDDNELTSALHLPTFAALAHYHGKHGRRSLRSVLDEAEQFAARDYPYALARGSRLSDGERRRVVAQIASLTGVSEDYVRRSRLRPDPDQFFSELLRDRGQVVGRLDGRFVGWARDGVDDGNDADPSYDAILGPYSAAFNQYVRAELGYENDLPYEIISPKVQPWSYQEFDGKLVSVVGRLTRAMRANPHLKVHVAFGYHDVATPYFAAEHVLAHLGLPPELAANIESKYYEAGHMMYVHEPSRQQQSKDLAAFITASS